MSSSDQYKRLFNALNEQTTVITPNHRLAATLRKLYHQFQQTENHSAWHTPDILPASTWLKRLWDETIALDIHTNIISLNATQEAVLWEQAIQSTPLSTPLLQTTQAAATARKAWSLISQWHVNIHDVRFQYCDDHLIPREWILRFLALCQKNHWIDQASAINQIEAWITAGTLPIKNKLIPIGFTEFSPQLNNILQHCDWEQFDIAAINSTAQHVSLPSPDDEIRTMATWAKQQALNGHHVACVIPDLNNKRDRVYQLFCEIFGEQPFNLSAGKPVAHYPLIEAAIHILRLGSHAPFNQFSYLLNTPYLYKAEQECIKRAKLEYKLRKDNQNVVPILSSRINKYCPLLSKALHKLAKRLNTQPVSQSPSAWVTVFDQLLSDMGWPGERSLNSEEYQLIRHWQELLEMITTLDIVLPIATLSTMVDIIQQQSHESIFQQQTPNANVDVLGNLEAAGLPFDYLWVSGMEDTRWPPQPSPNPFIPKQIQRELGMPHSTSERELGYCTNLLTQYKQHSTHQIYSHATMNKEVEIQPSPLISHIVNIDLSELNVLIDMPITQRIYDSKRLEWVHDDQLPPYINPALTKGGASILKQQALCPFKANVEWRLHTKQLEALSLGLRAKDRGNLLHTALEKIWNILNTHENLATYEHDALNELVQGVTKSVLTDYASRLPAQQHHLNLEQTRLNQLIMRWLDIEKVRPHFSVILHEADFHMTLDRLSINMRVDRVDRLDNGKELIIDYKSGSNNSITAWFSDRPEDPQLPLYLLSTDSQAAGIAYAQVNAKEMGFKGISQSILDIKGISPHADWSSLLAAWKEQLTLIATSFCDGHAAVDPKSMTKVCKNCSFQPLCRIHEEMEEA